MAIPIWTVDGKAMPRNPDSFNLKWDKANVSYQPQSDGSQIRTKAARLHLGADFQMTWMRSDSRTLNFMSQFFVPIYPAVNDYHKIVIGNSQPARQIYVYFDTPEKIMSPEVFTAKAGESGIRQDLTITLRTRDPHYRSVNTVPSTLYPAAPTAAQIAALFGGPIGNALDGIPVWSSTTYGWNFTMLVVNGNPISIQNLGTIGWLPTIRFNGPFSSLSITQTAADVDGTGLGTQFAWTGGSVAAGNYVLFDTAFDRCYLVSSGVKVEVYNFAVTTVSNGLPFMFWPELVPGSNTYTITAGGITSASTVDFSNAGTENFRYLL